MIEAVAVDRCFHPLSRYRVDHLKSIARRWLGRHSHGSRREDLLQVLPAALTDPVRVRLVLDGLSPAERAVLAVLSQSGGRATQDTLAVCLRLAGVAIPGDHDPGHRDPVDRLVYQMTYAGLLLAEGSILPDSPYERGAQRVSADPGLLGQIAPLMTTPFSLPPVPEEGLRTDPPRRPSALVLDVVALIEGVRSQGGLALTQQGTRRAAARAQLLRGLSWHRGLPVDLTQLREPVDFFLDVLCGAGLLCQDAHEVQATVGVDALWEQPAEALCERLLRGYLSPIEWACEEAVPARGSLRMAARRLLVESLRSLPEMGRSFVEMGALSREIFRRVGHRFRLQRTVEVAAPGWSQGPAAAPDAQVWQEAQAGLWDREERPFLESVLLGPLRALGLVQVALTATGALAVRLSDLGRAVLLSGSVLPPAAAAPRPALAVLPNLEIIVYLEHAPSQLLSFIERHAERVSAKEHTATYHITQAAIHAALSRGSERDEILATLEGAAGRPLPQNVRAQISDWCARAEQLTVRMAAQVLEFPSGAARAAAVGAGVRGRPVGERFLIVEGPPPEGVPVLDYAGPPPRALSLDEEGRVGLLPTADLLLPAQLRRLCGAGPLHLDRARLLALLDAGTSPVEVLAWLELRSATPLPPLLRLSLRSLGGHGPTLALAQAVLLQCPDEVTAQALSTSAALRPHVRGRLGPGILVLDEVAVEVARTLLRDLGLPAGPALLLQPLR